jgi:hypothetical protein
MRQTLRARRQRPAHGWGSDYFDEVAPSHCLAHALGLYCADYSREIRSAK